MLLSKLLKKVKVKSQINFQDLEINDVVYDSRKINEGNVFIALVGEKFDGHNYIKQAAKLGASVIVCSELPNDLNDVDLASAVIIQVEDTRLALAILSHTFFQNPSNSMTTIGITGTNGKTTCSFILKDIFEESGFNTAIIGTTGIYYNNNLLQASHTTPESRELAEIIADMRDNGVEVLIMEVSSHALVQHRSACINFDAAIYTNLTHDHLDYHKTVEEYAKAKKILFDNLKDNALAVINYDDKYAEFMIKDCNAQIIRVGKNPDSDLIISEIHSNIHTSNFVLINDSLVESYDSSLIGDFNVYNLAECIALASQIVVNDEDLYPSAIINAIENSKGAPGRMERYTLENRAVAIVDYAHTPDALEKALQVCRKLIKNDNKLIVVFGCGGDRDKSKRAIMGKISSKIADLIIITDDNPRSEDPFTICHEILSGIDLQEQKRASIISNREEAIKTALSFSKEGDIVLVAGKGHEQYQIYGTEKKHFSDSQVIRRYELQE